MEPVAATSSAEYVIRTVELGDLPAWWQLRLRALREHPDMFGSAYEEQEHWGADEVEHSYRERSIAGDNRLFAAFSAGNEPVATLGVVRPDRRKERHRAQIWGVYTAPEARGRGLSSRLLATAIAYCRSLSGVRQIHLNVSSHNHIAVRMYERAGFVRYGREPRALWLPNGPVDEDLMVRFLGGDKVG